MSEQLVYDQSPTSATSSTSLGRSNSSEDANIPFGNGDSSHTSSDKPEPATNDNTNFPPSKTDKPRPHICGTCGRSFARLEHLKRHERSHTKEKPFECPECTRCFARRDLLLRHQQKLHMTAIPSSKIKGGRRESISGLSSASAKVRKNSVASSVNGSSGGLGSGNIRPRANTIDGSALGLLMGSRSVLDNGEMGYDFAQQFNLVNGPGSFSSRTNIGNHARSRTLSQVPTRRMNASNGFALPSVPSDIAMDRMLDYDEVVPASGSTINPAQLHLDDSADSLESPFRDDFDWVRGLDSRLAFNSLHEHAIEQSSPSAMSTESPVVDNGMFGSVPHQAHAFAWPPDMNYHASGVPQFQADYRALHHSEYDMKMGVVSPTSLQHVENLYPTPPPMSSISPHDPMSALPSHFQNPAGFGSDHASSTSLSIGNDTRHSSVSSRSASSITEATRQALLLNLSQPPVFGSSHRRFSQPPISSPLSPHVSSTSTASLPCTEDLQRYVSAYIQYFHPHMPFLHIPSLSFDTPTYTSNLRPANSTPGFPHGSIVGGGGCLILAMAAVGALYEFDRAASKELFDSAKKMIQLYLEERRKADLAAASNSVRSTEHAAQNTPLWLVQAMLLNVIYGHNCGDKVSGDIASTHCSALVSLARAAELIKPLSDSRIYETTHQSMPTFPGTHEVQMADEVAFHDPWGLGVQDEHEQIQWQAWIEGEERKRTLYALFHMSSILVSAYNHAPAIMNSEIQLDLPCEEDLWCAETASVWTAKGGAHGAQQKSIPFAAALSKLLTASQMQNDQQMMSYNRPFGSSIAMEDLPQSEWRPSTFGCLVLINALHNYIWETRQRHAGRPWTTQETESMHAHIEPALRAWQAAWASNPTHSLERPNPFGMGPLSADSIPLLDLAYVRLFVSLGTSKEAFWHRDFDAMAEELARGSEIIQHAEHSENHSSETSASGSRKGSLAVGASADGELTVPPPSYIEQQTRSSKRERHLRKAAFYAADSLSMSDKLGVTFAEFTSRELPVQSALCTFDCAQVLAEWVSTVQERVGRYLGVLGKGRIDLGQVPAILLLEDEDCKLLEKIRDILSKAESKMTYEIGNMRTEAAMSAMRSLPSYSNKGYGSQILIVTAYMLERAAVWPVTSLMAHGLQIQAVHMERRAENSTVTTAN